MKVNHKKRSNAAINSWQDPMTRANRMAGICKAGLKKSRSMKRLYGSGRMNGELQRKCWMSAVSRMVIVCRVCEENFTPNAGNQLTCPKCLTERPFCKCGCGQRVRAVGSSGTKPRQFISGHNMNMLESKKIVSRKQKLNWKNPKYRNNITAVHRSHSKKIWDSYNIEERSARISSIVKGLRASPNRAESRLYELLQEVATDKFVMNTHARKVVAGCTPDILSKKGKVAVEMFGTYWHGKERTGRSKFEEERHRCNILAKEDYTTIIVWEDELFNIPLLRRRLLKLLRGVE